MGGVFLLFVCFFCFALSVFVFVLLLKLPRFGDLMYLDPAFSSDHCPHISGRGMKALATEQSSFLDQATCCDWSLFPVPSAYSAVSGRWRSILGRQGQVGSSAWAAVSLLLIPLATWVSFGKRGSLGPGRERECFPFMLIFGETPNGFFMPFVLGLPGVVKGMSSTQGRNELTWASCLRLLSQGLRNTRSMWFSGGWGSQEGLPLCCFSSPEVPNQLTFLTLFRLLLPLSLNPFSGFVVVLSGEEQGKNGSILSCLDWKFQFTLNKEHFILK